jgi:SAM-dependent methyltransferase
MAATPKQNESEMDQEKSRTHDAEIYLSESRYEEPKEIFKVLADMAAPLAGEGTNPSILDIGCAAGEFSYYLRKRFPTAVITGLDVIPSLLERARRMVPGARFVTADVHDGKAIEPQSQDAIFMCGVLSIFDRFEPVIENLLSWCRPGGKVFIFGLFNPHPADVWVQYRIFGKHEETHREVGWNVFSEASILDFVTRTHPQAACRFTPFQMSFPLPPHVGDPARTWTLETRDQGRVFVNGLAQLCPLQILEVSVK